MCPQIIGGAGSNTFAFDDQGSFNGTINGGTGTSNTIDYSAYTTGVTVNLNANPSTGFGAATGTAGIKNIQNITGGPGNDVLTASATGANVIVGGGGNDIITAGGGADTLSDGGGNDTFKFLNGWGTGTTVTNTGATGTATLDFSGLNATNNPTLAVTLNADGTVSVSDALGDTLTSVAGIQAVIGGPGANTFAFQDQAIFDGTLAGTLSSTTHDYSNNTLDYSLYNSDVEVNLGLGIATGTNGISNIWNATGGQGNNTLIGDANNNTLIGGPANNMFTGGGGTNTITGNTTGTNTIVETQDVSNMTLIGTVASSTLTIANNGTTVGTDNLTNIQAAILTGGLHSTTINASQFSGNVTLDAGSQTLLSALEYGFSTTDATDPGLTGSTPLSSLNDGAGVDLASGDGFTVTLTDGTTFNVDLSTITNSSPTLQDVFNAITNAAPKANEVENVALTGSTTGGAFTLSYNGQTTAGIGYNATAGQVQSALTALWA